MNYNFITDDERRAKAALLLYAMYRSRDEKSSLNGLETWNRMHSYMRAACLKAETTAEFVEEFCRKAKIDSIKPVYLTTEPPLIQLNDGSLVQPDGAYDFALDAYEDGTLELYNSEALYLIMLVRERLQREKLGFGGNDNE